jgi:hypothetical protein
MLTRAVNSDCANGVLKQLTDDFRFFIANDFQFFYAAKDSTLTTFIRLAHSPKTVSKTVTSDE